MSVNFIHTISNDALWATQEQISAILANAGIEPDQLHLIDLAAQVAVGKVRELAAELDLCYIYNDWTFTPDGEVEVHFEGLPTKADAQRLKRALS